MTEKLYAIYGFGAVPQTLEMIQGKAIYWNRPVGQYSDGATVWRVWFLEPPSTQREADEIAERIAKQGADGAPILALAVLGIAAVTGVFRYFFNKKSQSR